MRIIPAQEYNVSLTDGTVTKAEVPQRYNAELDMELVTDTEIFVGKNLSIVTKDFTGAGYVIKMEKVEK